MTEGEDAETVSLPTTDQPQTTPTLDNPALTKKIDPITALQESIDSLSLAMFEALRGVRDAVAPESGNLGASQGPQQAAAAAASTTDTATATNPEDAVDVDEMWRLYRSGDATVTSMIQRISPSSITRREEFVRIYTKIEIERKDSELVGKFASMVLDKFDEIRRGVNQVPGLHRTRTQQMSCIQELMEQNAQLQQQLDEAYLQAKQRQTRIYQLVEDQTNRALGFDVVGNTDATTSNSNAAFPLGFDDGNNETGAVSSSASFGLQQEATAAMDTTTSTPSEPFELQPEANIAMDEVPADDQGWLQELDI